MINCSDHKAPKQKTTSYINSINPSPGPKSSCVFGETGLINPKP
jgi:hypothetical protein